MFFNLKNSIRAHVRYKAFATLHIELYRVVDYDSKWSTKFYEGLYVGIFLIAILRSHLKYIF